MKSKALSTSLQSLSKFPILGNLEVEINVEENELQLPVESLFKMAARINKKRAFLFVSKVLGKHLRVNPLDPLIISALLALRYHGTSEYEERMVRALLSDQTNQKKTAYEAFLSKKIELQQESIVVGFAETATALGHGVFDSFSNAQYIHTTREEILGDNPLLTFEEEHSHAVDQRCYSSHHFFENEKPIILVDDEMTTGKTTINIIRDIHAKYPRNQYGVLSILDWRSEEHIEAFRQLEQELNISIQTVSLLKGSFRCYGEPLLNEFTIEQGDKINSLPTIDRVDLSNVFTPSSFVPIKGSRASYVHESGRFGLDSKEALRVQHACKMAAEMITRQGTEDEVLCIGTGEFMYIPMKIATYMDGNVYYQSSTRSPIHCHNEESYAIQNKISYLNPEENNTTHFLYNIELNRFNHVILFFERSVEVKKMNTLLSYFHKQGVQRVTIVECSKDKEEESCSQG
ncbi:phosphoribosyltransferase family protein [Bacillus spongiae]|uniref:Phosphoribosyltransferase family protein n=1 Tax=Bacillus spongiae TaxID=2683610 RepID=A0ABU8H995_9BACI